jgi:GNAT superfamily N-acetyltransferase
VHRRFVEQGEYGGANVATPRTVPALRVLVGHTEAAAAVTTAPSAAVAAVAMGVPLGAVHMVVVVESIVDRLVVVMKVSHGGFSFLVSHDRLRVIAIYRQHITTRRLFPSGCARLDGGVELRAAMVDDVDVCLAVQRRSAVVGYGHIFDQQTYPFPDDVVRGEWLDRLAGEVPVTLAIVDGEVVGTVSIRPPRLESLFVVPEQWGSEVGGRLHHAALGQIRAGGWLAAELDVMVDNARARRFYEKHGWAPDGRTAVSPFPPYPRLLGYRRHFDDRQ